MLAALAFATILPLAQASAAAAPAPAPATAPATIEAPPSASATVETGDESCDEAARGSGDTRDIVVCAQRPQGYRLNPDVMAAKNAKKRLGRGAAPKRPENFKQNDCATVGPMGCREGPVIDLVSAALVAAQMAVKAVQGENVGKMFVTDPNPSEYQLYQMAKAQREEREAEEAADKIRAEVRAKDAAKPRPVSVADEPR